MNPLYQEVSIFFQNFIDSISKDLIRVSQGEDQLVLPHVPLSFLLPFLREMKKQFESEPPLLELDGSFVIVGDLHGHFLDLCRIFKTFQFPSPFKYVFLGDIVDRGEFSFETIFVIFLLKYLYPKSVYIIRGNHEFLSICSQFGFQAEVESIFPGDNIFALIVEIFSYLPLAALLQQKILCVHGGLTPDLNTLDQLRALQKPIIEDDHEIVDGLTWSDPFEAVLSFIENPRGRGYLFGQTQIYHFNKNNSLTMIVRGHQCVANGIKYQFDKSIVTVFSASNYCGQACNMCGVLILSAEGIVKKRIFPAFDYLKRDKVLFNDNILPNHLMAKILPSFHIHVPNTLLSTKKLLTCLKQKKQQIQRKSVVDLYLIDV